ncbi:hypothetical protein RCC89_06125 [Cytophagaceae bacterium ABcell3]|nr:hypothetical protein RCC89_06125 [Cytophagaceae bacterium ABcell3]
MKFKHKLLLTLVVTLYSLSPVFAGPGLQVRVFQDDLRESRKAYVSVFKKNKDVSDRFEVKEFEVILLNTQGRVKWTKKIEDSVEIDLSEEDFRISQGELIIIKNAHIIDKKKGDWEIVEDISDRYLIR